MSLFSSAGHDGKIVALFNIGSSSVTATLARIFPKETKVIPTILFSSTHKMEIAENLNFPKFMSEMLSALDESAADLANAKLGAPEEFHCFLASPWYASQTRTIKIEKNVPFIFTKKFHDELVAKEISLFEGEALKSFNEKGEHARIIENHTIRILLNGYETAMPFGNRIRAAEMTLFISLSPEEVLAALDGCMRKHFHASKISFHSFICAGFVIVRDLFDSQKEFMFIDVGGEITDVALVKNGILTETVSFPYGKNFLLRRLATGLNRSLTDVAALFALYRDDKLESGIKASFEKILEPARAEWVRAFTAALERIPHGFLLPEAIFLIAGNDVSLWFAQALASEELKHHTLTEKDFAVVLLEKNALAKFVNVSSEAHLNHFSVIEAIFISHI